MRLTIDVRKAFDTGIGTYIRELVPRVIRLWPVTEPVSVVIGRGQRALHDYLADCPASFIEVTARPFTLAEQWELRRLVRRDSLFWATSLAHPLYAQGPFVNSVFDLIQLALPSSLGGSAKQRLLARPFFDSIRRQSRQLLFSSDFTAAEFRRLVGLPCAAADITPLGVDSTWFEPASGDDARPLDGPYFVMLGNLRPHKNLALAVQAMAQVAPRLPHKLLVIGPDSPSQAGHQVLLGAQARLGPRVVFTGHLTRAQVQQALRHAEALLFPSRYEGFGLPVLEALATGCPVLVARNGVSPQIAGPGAASFEPHDVDGLANAMIDQALMLPSEKQRRARIGVTHARSFSWDRTADLTVAALDRTVRRLQAAAPTRASLA